MPPLARSSTAIAARRAHAATHPHVLLVVAAGFLGALLCPPPARAAVSLSVSQSIVWVAPPATGSTLVSWRSPAPVRVFVSRDGGPETLFATSPSGSGQQVAQIASQHDYRFRLYAGLADTSRLLKIVRVRGELRILRSTSPTLARRPDGKLDVFVQTLDGGAAMATYAPRGGFSRSWTRIDGNLFGPPTGSWSPDGRTLDIFAISRDLKVIRRRFTAAGGWGDWNEVPAAAQAGCAAGNDVCGTVAVARCGDEVNLFIRGNDGDAFTEKLTASGQLVTPWNRLHKTVVGAPSVSCGTDGRSLDVVAVGADYFIHQISWNAATGWGPWSREPGHANSGAATVGLAGGSERRLFARTIHGNVLTETLRSDGQLLRRWSTFGKRVVGAPAASWNADRSVLDAVVIGNDNLIYRRQLRPGRGWSEWVARQIASIRVGIASLAASPASADDVQVFGRGNDGEAYLASLEEASAPWSAMLQPAADAPAASYSPEARKLDVVAAGSDGSIYRRELADGGSSGWTAPLSGAPAASSAPTVSGSADAVTVGVRGADGSGYVATIPRGATAPERWERLGGPLLGSPAVSWSADGRILDVAAVGTDHRVYRRQYRVGTGWTTWAEAPGGARVDSGSIGLAGDRFTVTMLVRGSDGEAYFQTIARTGQLLNGWSPMHRKVADAPSAAWSSDRRRLEVVAVDDAAIWRSAFVRGEGWRTWRQLLEGGSAPVLGVPAAAPPLGNPLLGGLDEPILPVIPPADGLVSVAAPPVPDIPISGDLPPVPSGSLPPAVQG